jgi:hypothetical protein
MLEIPNCQQCEQQIYKEKAWVVVASFNPTTPRSALTRLIK